MVKAHNRLEGPFSLPVRTHWAFPTNRALSLLREQLVEGKKKKR